MKKIEAIWPPPDPPDGGWQETMAVVAKHLRSQLEEYLKHDGANPDLQKVVDGIVRDLLDGENVQGQIHPERKPGAKADLDREVAIITEVTRLMTTYGLSKLRAKRALIDAMGKAGERGDLAKQIDRAIKAWGIHIPRG